MPLLIPPIAAGTSLRTALILLFPTLYLISSGLFFVSYLFYKTKRDVRLAIVVSGDGSNEALLKGTINPK